MVPPFSDGWDLWHWGPARRAGNTSNVNASKTLESTEIEATEIEVTGVVPIGVESAGLLAVVADPVRWRLLAHLASGTTTCVCDLQPIAAVAANLLSYHLKVLRAAGLVETRRRGRWMDYTITADALDRLHAALPAAGALGTDELLAGACATGGTP